MAKPLLNVTPPGASFVSWNSLLFVANIKLYRFHGKMSGLLDIAKIQR